MFEVLELANKQKTIANRVEVLQEYRYPGLVSKILIWNFDEAAKCHYFQKELFLMKEMKFTVGTESYIT